jgi:hypothetical protein
VHIYNRVTNHMTQRIGKNSLKLNEGLGSHFLATVSLLHQVSCTRFPDDL